MAFVGINIFRTFKTTRALCKNYLSESYLSEKLWTERLNCQTLSGDQEILKGINQRIITGNSLNSFELDVFVNVANPSSDNVSQLNESINQLRGIRRSLLAHTIMPSTCQALSRLFIDSNRLPSLIHALEQRSDFGLFPDFYTMNILIDKALELEKYDLGTKLASYVMLQEEFGLNKITDALSIIATSQYLHKKTDFSNFAVHDANSDPIFAQTKSETSNEQFEPNKQSNDDEEEGEEDANYVRVPFLINPYNDNHFDLTCPRLISAKILRSLGKVYRDKNEALSMRLKVIGEILAGEWSEVSTSLDSLRQSNVSMRDCDKELCHHYIENSLMELTAAEPDLREKICSKLDQVPIGPESLLNQAESIIENSGDQEKADIEDLRRGFQEASEYRSHLKKAKLEKEERERLIAEIKVKKEELRLKEQYLYFYDEIRKKNLTRIDYN